MGDELSPEKTHQNERLERAITEETVEAMIQRYKDYGAPIDKPNYIRGDS